MATDKKPNLSPTDLVCAKLCLRKLWLAKNGVRLEFENEHVAIGKTISRETYSKNKKELQLFNFGVLDSAVLKNGTIIEVKKSSKYEYLHIIQVTAYLEWLQTHNVMVKEAIIKYPTEKRTKKIILTQAHVNELQNIKTSAYQTLQLEQPPKAIKIGACRGCSYEEFCWL